MNKLESRIPLQIKSFSDFSREYLKLLEEIFDIDYAWKTKYLEILGWMKSHKIIGQLYADRFQILYVSN